MTFVLQKELGFLHAFVKKRSSIIVNDGGLLCHFQIGIGEGHSAV